MGIVRRVLRSLQPQANGLSARMHARYHHSLAGSSICEGRYQILQQLDFGSHGTVWHARDKLDRSDVAIKVADTVLAEKEFMVLQHLKESSIALTYREHPGRQYISYPLNKFHLSADSTGLVFELLGMSLAQRIETCSSELSGPDITISTITQVIQAVDYIEKCGVSQGDFRDANIIFSQSGDIRVIDFSSAFFHDDTPDRLVTPLHLQPPEALMRQQLSTFTDRWQLGCLIVYLVTGRDFVVPSAFCDSFDILDVIQSYLGPPPTWSNDQQFTEEPCEWSLQEYVKMLYRRDSRLDDEDEIMEESVRPALDLTADQLDAVCRVITGLLKYEQRDSPAELLRGLSNMK